MEREELVIAQLHQVEIVLSDDWGRCYRLQDQRDDRRSRLESPYNHQVMQALVMGELVVLTHIFYTQAIVRYSRGKGYIGFKKQIQPTLSTLHHFCKTFNTWGFCHIGNTDGYITLS